MPKIHYTAIEKVPHSFKFYHGEKQKPWEKWDPSPKCAKIENLPCNF